MSDLIPSSQTMTSREIADLTGKRHDHVLRDIDNLAQTLSPELGNGFKSATYKDGNGIERRMVILDRDSTYCLVAGYDANARMKIIKRWQDLEANKLALPDFTDPVAAARAWADARESEQKALVQLQAAKPAVEYHARVALTDDAHTLDEAAKILRAGPRKFRQWLKDNRLLRLDGTPIQEYMNRGYFKLIEKSVDLPNGRSKMYAQTYITGKGMQYLQVRIDHHLMGQEV